MALENHNNWARTHHADVAEVDAGLRAYMLRVYNYMASGIVLTGIVSWLVANSSLFNLFFNAKGMTGLSWVLMFGTIGLVFFLSARLHAISASTAQALFWVYAALNGAWLSSIFIMYTGTSIVRVFLITAGSFAGLSLYGYVTKRNLSGLGSFMIMGLWGLLIGTVVNLFLASTAMHWILSIVGVLVFAGLTAYDTQKIKEMYYEADDRDVMTKKSIMGALTLYLDFINLFLYLLRFFGQNRN